MGTEANIKNGNKIRIKNDGTIALATANKRTAKLWKNKEVQWSSLVEKLSKTTRTPETTADYKKMSKKDKGKVKDVGGFVAGCLKEGKRKAENVQNRSMLTLDIDYAESTKALWGNIEILWDFAVLMYSTHTHTPDNPRLRLLIPLDRPVLPDEYQAIARMIASDLGMDIFDDTTYQPCRLMFWPSTPCDGEYVFKYQDLPWLNPDEVLSRYTFGWQDVSYWPESSRARAKLERTLKKQEDPLEKPGVIGSFCRTYTIQDAIETFLSDVYEQGKDDTRYTYIPGSTSGGLVIYQNKFAYSHHGTDPASSILCNAFDLVRIHLFGELDDDAKDDTPANRLPSFTKMKEFASKDKATLISIGKEKMQSVEEDFGPIDEEDEPDLTWLEKLEYTEAGKLRSTISNFLLIIENEPYLKGRIAFNEFSNRNNVIGQLPWRKENNYEDWTDTDDSGLREFIEKHYGISSTTKLDDALNLSYEQHRFHPIRDYLNSLSWDGKERVSKLLIDYLGAKDMDYTRTVTRKVLVAAVKRVFEPGCKFDNMLILSGKQGVGKSTIIKKLGRQWYSDSLTTVSGKEAYEQLQGVWILEMAEMMATRKADIEATKHFLSKQEDIYRVAYGRRTTRFPRQCIFIGTSNEHEFLRDKTGNRRFWPVDIYQQEPVKNVFKDLDLEVDQIWAEAYQLYKDGETLYLNAEEEKEARKQQGEHSEESAKAGLVEEFLNKPITEDWYSRSLSDKRLYLGGDFGDEPQGDTRREKTCVIEIWCELFNGDPKQLTPAISRELNDILRGLDGWEKTGTLRFGKVYGSQRGYRRKEK